MHKKCSTQQWKKEDLLYCVLICGDFSQATKEIFQTIKVFYTHDKILKYNERRPRRFILYRDAAVHRQARKIVICIDFRISFLMVEVIHSMSTRN